MRIKRQDLYNSRITEEEKAWAKDWFVEAEYSASLEEVDEEALMDYLYDDKKDQLDTLLFAMREVTGPFIAYADMGLWNGRRQGYKWLKAKTLNDAVLEIISSDYGELEIYTENGDLKLTGYHHDGTNYITIRRAKEGLTLFRDDELNPSWRKRYTRGLAKEALAKW